MVGYQFDNSGVVKMADKKPRRLYALADLAMKKAASTSPVIDDMAELEALNLIGSDEHLYKAWREVKADEYALQTTQNSQAFSSAMTRLANQNLADAEPPAWVEFLLHSHPSINERVAMAKSFSVEN